MIALSGIDVACIEIATGLHPYFYNVSKAFEASKLGE